MKEGWTYKKLGEVGTFVRGGGFLKRDYVENGIPCIHYGQIHTVLGNVTTEHLTSISEELRSKTKFASKGDVIFAITSEDVEGSCKCTAWMGDYDVAVGGHAAIYKSSLNPAYVSYYAKSPVFYNAKKQYVHGFKVMEIKPADIAQINIPVPSLDEQQRIVERLDSAFENIDKLKANAEKQLAEARTLFQKSLAKAMEPKEGWDVDNVEHVSKEMFSGGDAPKTFLSNVKSDKYPIPVFANAVENDGLYGYTNAARVNEPALTIAARGSGTGYALKRYEPFLPIVRLIVVVPNDSVTLDFLYYTFVSRNIRKTGSAIPQLTIPMLRKVQIYYPNSIEEQMNITKRLDSLSENVRKYEEIQRQIISECDALKQALLRKVFE